MPENKIEKPVTIIKKELTENIVKCINDAPLPMFVIEYILKDILNDVKVASQKQLEFDVNNYNEKLKQINECEE